MKIVVTGTRGIPDILGGVETHCQELYPRINLQKDCDIVLIRRSCYTDNESSPILSYKGIELKDLYAPRKKSLEAIVHTFMAILYAKKINADIIHIHAIGPALLTPFARLLGLKVVFTHHGPDYDRQKWGKLAKFILKSGEKMGTKYADEVIVISSVIQNSLIKLYNRTNTHLIFNGVTLPTLSKCNDYIESLGLEKGKYIVAIGRFVEEKGFHDLIKAYQNLDSDMKLVIAGDADHESAYSRDLKRVANERGVVLTGFIKGQKLNDLMSHARLFVMPSYHEGLPIALLEAMSYGLDVVVSDIPANKQVALPNGCYFKTGDIPSLTSKISEHLNSKYELKEYDLSSYNWDHIANQVIDVYEGIMHNK